MRKTLLTLALLLPTVGGVLALPSAASAAPTVKQAAIEVTKEKVFGSKYGYYKKTKPYSTKLDWANNGCSVPFSVNITNHYKAVFEKSCDRHDFGYRNHKTSGLSRKTVDDRFKSNMDAQCLKRYDDKIDIPARAACYGASKVFYEAVRKFGGKNWN